MASRTVRKTWLAIALALAMTLGVAACGSDDSSNGSDGGGGGETSQSSDQPSSVETAQQRIKENQQPAKFVAPGPAFDAGKAKGKDIEWISLNANISFTEGIYGPFKEAMDAAGVNVNIFNGKSNPAEWARGIDAAVAKHPDLIVLQAIPASVVQAPLKAAQEAGIPVLEFGNHNADAPPSPGTDAALSYCYTCVGKMMVDVAVANTDGKPDMVFFTSSDVTNSVDELDGIKAELSELCPDCRLQVKDVPVAQWATRLSVLTQNAVKDPKVNYLLAAYDDMTISMVPGVHAANAQDRVGLVSFNANAGPMEMLKNEDVITADIGSPLPWTGWAIADQSLRVMSGVDPVQESPLPYYIFTRDNVQDLDLEAPDTWYGPTDFRADYKKLWGLQ